MQSKTIFLPGLGRIVVDERGCFLAARGEPSRGRVEIDGALYELSDLNPQLVLDLMESLSEAKSTLGALWTGGAP